LVKTVRFEKPRYLGDPINTIKIFNTKEVDELIVLDIDATVQNREPNYQFINILATECFMPFTYGGGVKTVDQLVKLISLGVEKISFSTAALENPRVIEESAKVCGTSSVVVTIDVRKKRLSGAYDVVSHNGSRWHSKDPIEFAREMQERGAGELVINSVDNDGMMQGYDEKLIKGIISKVSIPVVVLGGAGKLEDMRNVIQNLGASAAAAGSLFVYQGVHRAVLINYPTESIVDKIFGL
jgi:cyclase